MKTKISYLPEEEGEAAADLAVLKLRHPGAKVRKSDRHPPYRHIYITTPHTVEDLRKPCNTNENMV